MHNTSLFIGAATQQGYSSAAARNAFDEVWAQLETHGWTKRACCFVFRSASSGGSSDGTSDGSSPSASRLLVAFPSADAALSFAQRNNLGTAPRLVALSPVQLLAALMQRPTIGAVIFADDSDEAVQRSTLPPGLRVERSTLLALLTKGSSER